MPKQEDKPIYSVNINYYKDGTHSYKTREETSRTTKYDYCYRDGTTTSTYKHKKSKN